MKKFLLFISLLFAIPLANAQFFYFWTEDYTVVPDVDGSVFVSAFIKSSDYSTYTISINGKIISDNVEVFPNEVVNFPIFIGKKYTQGVDNILLCSSKKESAVNFKQEICLSISLQY